MLKIVSENFIHALLLFLGLFLNISRWVPLLFTVRHVFVEFVEGMESGIRNPECGIRNPFPFVICGKKSFHIYNIFLYLFFFKL